MRGYKGMNTDMTCREKQYEIGKTYTETNVELCVHGMHYCKNLSDVFGYYGFSYYGQENGNRFFEVEANEIATDGKKSVADTLTVIRELEPKEVNRNIYGNGSGNGNGNVHGWGYGDSFFCEDGNGRGNGNGNFYGDGQGNGYNFNYGNGLGYGQENGNGHGNSEGGDIQKVLMYCN